MSTEEVVAACVCVRSGPVWGFGCVCGKFDLLSRLSTNGFFVLPPNTFDFMALNAILNRGFT